MKSNLLALMSGAAFGLAFGSLISLLSDRDTFVLSLDADKFTDALDRHYKSATLRDLYEDNKISCEREGGVDL